MKKTILLILLSILILIIFLIPYFNIRNEVELKNETFASIGSYISGIVAILNLCIFIYLTNLIANYDKIKHKSEINIQKLIIQSQFRQSELEKLIEILEKIYEIDGAANREKSLLRIANTSVKLNGFLTQKQYLFPILKDKRYRDLGDKIIETFEEMIEVLQRKDEDYKLINLLNTFDIQRNEFIHSLQGFIIIELEK